MRNAATRAMNDSDTGEHIGSERDPGFHFLLLHLEDFTWETLVEEASALEVTVEEFTRFALLYYFADHDSRRLARRMPPTW